MNQIHDWERDTYSYVDTKVLSMYEKNTYMGNTYGIIELPLNSYKIIIKAILNPRVEHADVLEPQQYITNLQSVTIRSDMFIQATKATESMMES